MKVWVLDRCIHLYCHVLSKKMIYFVFIIGAIIGSETIHEKNVMAVSYVPNSLKVSIKMIGQLSNDKPKTVATSNVKSASPTTNSM